jgi:hypothetical protein
MCGQAAAVTVIDTTPWWDFRSSICCYGEPLGITVGETFTVPLRDNVLTSFSFWVANRPGLSSPGPSRFSAYVMQWDNEKMRATWDGELDGSTQPILYESPMLVKQNSEVYPPLEELTFHTGALWLAPGYPYVVFFSPSEYLDGVSDNFSVGVLAGFFADQPDVYGLGTGVEVVSGDDTAAWMSQRWSDEWGGDPYELAFRAVYVPEPGGFVMAITAAAGLLMVGASKVLGRWRRAGRHEAMFVDGRRSDAAGHGQQAVP